MVDRQTKHPSARRAVRSFLLLTIIALFTALCYDREGRSQEYVFRAYRQTQGLENLAVNSIAVDARGFLWVGTENGIYRFLGSSLQRFGASQGISEPYITQVFAAGDGTLWVASDQNLYSWNGEEFQPAASTPIKISRASSLASAGPGDLLVITGGKLYHLRYGVGAVAGGERRLEPFFAADQLTAHPSLGHLGAIAALPAGTVWMACAKAVCSWTPELRQNAKGGAGSQRGVITEWRESQGVAPESYRSVLQDRSGALWAVGLKHIVARLPGSPDQPHPAFVDRSLPEIAGRGAYSRLPIACDPMGRVIVSMAGGVARWEGSSWRLVGKPNGLISTHLTALVFDERGNLWMGSIGHGLYHWIGYSDWEGWIDNQGLPSSNIWSIAAFRGGRAWIGTERGIGTLDAGNGRVTEPAFARNWPYGQVTGVIAGPKAPVASSGIVADGPLLITTLPGKVLRVEGHPARMTIVADLQDYIYQMLRDLSGRTFLIADFGVFDVSRNFEGGPRTALDAPIPQVNALLGPQPGITQGCVAPDGAVWFLGGGGLVRLAQEANRDIWSRPSLEGLPNPLPRLNSLACAKDGTLWVAAGGTTVWHAVYDQGNKAATGLASGSLVTNRLRLPEALQSIAIVDMLADARGWLWIGTDDGLLAWNGSSWRHLTQEDGLIWNDLNANKMTEGPDGSIWLATSGGLSRILHPEHVFAVSVPRIAVIEARIGGQRLPLGADLRLPWSRQDMSFQFAAPDTINRADLRFYYRLAGLHPGWIESRDQTAHFQALPSGVYSFEVFARDRVNGARSAVAAVHFRILPPWWRTWWFYALCGLGTALAIVFIFRLRTRHLIARQHRLEAMVSERTAQLEASREELRRQATHDGLTGMPNRAAILNAFDQELARARRDASPLIVALADIDHFKHVNDTYGHLAGDEALRRFSAALSASLRPYDHVGRYGGEEFLLILVGVDRDGVDERLAALHRCISGLEIIHEGRGFAITCSLGIVQIEELQGGNEQKLALAAADEALYEAKRTGRNRFVVGHLASPTPSE